MRATRQLRWHVHHLLALGQQPVEVMAGDEQVLGAGRFGTDRDGWAIEGRNWARPARGESATRVPTSATECASVASLLVW